MMLFSDVEYVPALTPTRWGLACLATGSSSDEIGVSQSEDCLFINVFAPSNATAKSKLPVFAYVQGGGFNADASPFLNGSGIIPAAEYDMILVTMNYRVGPYGFLTDGSSVTPNIALLDQRKALTWIQNHITAFGGNPDHVVLGGASAGAASVSLQLAAYGGRDTNLFHAAAAESVSFATVLTVDEAQFQYDNFAIRLGCAGANSLECLRSKSAEELQDQNLDIVPYPGATNPPLWLWNPVIDGDLIQDLTYNSFKNGNFIKMPSIFGDDTNGGTVFTPQNTSSIGESDQFLKDLFPYMTLEQIGTINSLYPNKNTSCPAEGCYWEQLSKSYGDMRYLCPSLFIASSISHYANSPSWSYRYNVQDPTLVAEGFGVPHTSEVGAIFGPEYIGGGAPASLSPGQMNAHAVPVLQGYWTSFIRTFNPNTHRYPGTVKWEEWTDKGQDRILFDTGGKTYMETVSKTQQRQCAYIASIGAQIHQ
jgi:cholinesterase